MLFDGDEDGIFGEPGDDIKPLADGTMDIMALDATAAAGVGIDAVDDLGHSGSDTYISCRCPKCSKSTL